MDNRKVEIDRDAKTMDVTYTLDPGPVMRFGPVAISGLERLNPWQGGEIYNASKVEETRRALIESGFSARRRSGPPPIPSTLGRRG
jgi:translocation and assembly module TamA